MSPALPSSSLDCVALRLQPDTVVNVLTNVRPARCVIFIEHLVDEGMGTYDDQPSHEHHKGSEMLSGQGSPHNRYPSGLAFEHWC